MLGCLAIFSSVQTPGYAQDGIDWVFQTVDSAGDVGLFNSLAFDTSGGPAISYDDYRNGDLNFAYDRNNDGDFDDAGEIITVDSHFSVGRYTSLAFGTGPAISYHNAFNMDLKFARYSPTHTWSFHAPGFFPRHLPDNYTGQVMLADLDPATIPDEVQGVWWYDGPVLEWKFWVPGVGGELTTLGGGHTYDYNVLVTGACDWEIQLP